MTEEWRPSPIFGDRYEVSSFGRVRSARGIKSAHKDKDGYPTVNLHRAGQRKACNVHRLVCRAFHGEPFAPCREAAHLDGNRANSRADNLAWVGKIQNHSHRRHHGTDPAGERHPGAKLSGEQVLAIRRAKGCESGAELAARFEVSRRTIYEIWEGKRWGHLDTKCERSVGNADAPNPSDPTIPNNPTSSMGERL